MHLNKNPETLVWELESVETELWQEPPDPFLESIAAFLSSVGERWEGTASELCCLLHLDCKPNVLSLRLSISSVRLLRDHDIHYKASRNHGGRKISLWKEMEPDSVSKGIEHWGAARRLLGQSPGAEAVFNIPPLCKPPRRAQ